MLNLDTHIFIHALQDNLKKQERQLLAQHSWSISAIVLWELAKLSQLKRITLDLHSPDFSRVLSRIHIWPLDWLFAIKSQNLIFKAIRLMRS